MGDNFSPTVIDLAGGETTSIETGNQNPRVLIDKSGLRLFDNSGAVVVKIGSDGTVTLPATGVSGQLSDAQIASLSASKITGQLTSAQIASVLASAISGSIQGTQIANGAITTNLIAANAITAALIAAGAIDGKVITGATIQTAASGDRTWMDSTGLNLTAGTSSSVPPTQDRIDWHRQSDGAQVAVIFAQDDANSNLSVAEMAGQAGSAGRGVIAELAAWDHTGAQLAMLQVNGLDGGALSAQKVYMNVQGWIKTLLDGTGASDFLQKANNLSDVAASSTARANLGLATPAWTAPAFAANWSNAGAGFSTAGYRLTPFGTVEVKGVIVSTAAMATGNNIFTALPAAYRPAEHRVVRVYDSAVGVARMDVDTSGNVTFVGASGARTVSLDGCFYPL